MKQIWLNLFLVLGSSLLFVTEIGKMRKWLCFAFGELKSVGIFDNENNEMINKMD